jgi:hypothetical protein
LLLASTQSYPDLTVDRTFIGNNVYTFTLVNISTTTGINLTFDAQNNPNEVFVIRTDGAFTANGALTFTLENQAQADNIFWIIGTIGTISVGSSGPITFDGNVLAGQSFTMSAASGGSGVLAGTIDGCAFAETANTLAGQTTVNGCVGGGLPGGGPGVPEPGSSGLVDGANRALVESSRPMPAAEERNKMKLVIVAGLAFTTSLLAIDNEPAKRLGEAASVFRK